VFPFRCNEKPVSHFPSAEAGYFCEAPTEGAFNNSTGPLQVDRGTHMILHMILHLPWEALLGGTVQTRWQYGPERETKKLREMCGNKCKIEASIAEAVLKVEVSNFTTKYYDENIATRHNPVLRYNAADPKDVAQLSIFIGLGGKSSGTQKKCIKNQEWEEIHTYVLKSMDEVKPYIE
jgi:hypothetical protein